jgi:hypothetical protein
MEEDEYKALVKAEKADPTRSERLELMNEQLRRVYLAGVQDGYTVAYYNENTEEHRSQTETPIFRAMIHEAFESAETWVQDNGRRMQKARYGRNKFGDDRMRWKKWMESFLLNGEPWNQER